MEQREHHPERGTERVEVVAQELEHQNKHEVRIHIDQHRYESPNPTTAAALYLLGHVAPGLELYREVNGNREDEPIENGQKSSA